MALALDAVSWGILEARRDCVNLTSESGLSLLTGSLDDYG